MLDVFTTLRLLGIGLTLDNFGTGCSSLTELCQMPFTEIKIDGSLVAGIPHERERSLIVRAIVELAHTLGLRAAPKASKALRPSTTCVKLAVMRYRDASCVARCVLVISKRLHDVTRTETARAEKIAPDPSSLRRFVQVGAAAAWHRRPGLLCE